MFHHSADIKNMPSSSMVLYLIQTPLKNRFPLIRVPLVIIINSNTIVIWLYQWKIFFAAPIRNLHGWTIVMTFCRTVFTKKRVNKQKKVLLICGEKKNRGNSFACEKAVSLRMGSAWSVWVSILLHYLLNISLIDLHDRLLTNSL